MESLWILLLGECGSAIGDLERVRLVVKSFDVGEFICIAVLYIPVSRSFIRKSFSFFISGTFLFDDEEELWSLIVSLFSLACSDLE